MSDSQVSAIKEVSYKMPKSCQTDSAKQIYSELLDVYKSGFDMIAIDFTEVAIMSTSVMQILASFLSKIKNDNKKAKLINLTEECNRAASYIGFSPLLKEWGV